jgi:predicted ABC-type ATPase
MATDEEIRERAIAYIKANKKLIKKAFADPYLYPKSDHPVAVFMSGSPGAGKTEVSKQLVKVFEKPTVRIDADEIRNLIPGYTGSNASLFQGGAALGVEKVLDFCIEKSRSFILDGLLADSAKAQQNIRRCLDHRFEVIVLYVYQKPALAWNFTLIREKVEGRNISREVFIHGLIESRSVAQQVKDEFGSQVRLLVLEKDYQNGVQKVWEDVKKISDLIEALPSIEELDKILS